MRLPPPTDPSFLQEAVVVAHDQLALDLLHGSPPEELDIEKAANVIAGVGAELSDSIEMAVSYFRSTVDLDQLDARRLVRLETEQMPAAAFGDERMLLERFLERPRHERPFVLFPVGYPADDATVPHIERKPLEEVAVFDPPLADPAED